MAEAVRERKKGSPGGTQSDPQKEQRKKTALAALVMLVPFCAGMYLIFEGSGQDTAPGAGSINLTVPDGRSAGIEASKQKAIENVRMQQRQQERSPSTRRLSRCWPMLRRKPNPCAGKLWPVHSRPTGRRQR